MVKIEIDGEAYSVERGQDKLRIGERDGYSVVLKWGEACPLTYIGHERERSTVQWRSGSGVQAFLNEIAEVCKRHGMSISHEDQHGSFIIKPFDQYNIDWLNDATDRTGEP
jgi:hypothetical protein